MAAASQAPTANSNVSIGCADSAGRVSNSGKAGTHRWRKLNQPPKGEPWIWITQAMLESSAWRAMTRPALQVLFRVLIEHCGHGGTENGSLPVTYDDFVEFGIRRGSIVQGIEIAQALGFLDVTKRGYAFGTRKVASEYAVTFFPRANGAPATNRWKAIKEDEAQCIVKAVQSRRRRKRKPILRQNIDRGSENVPGTVVSFPSGRVSN